VMVAIRRPEGLLHPFYLGWLKQAGVIVENLIGYEDGRK
jgi:hypothetical protein